MDDIADPDTLALLLVQQYLDERGYMSGEHIGFCSEFVLDPQPAENPSLHCGCCAALKELERQQGLRYVSDKLPKGSMLLEVRHSFLPGLSRSTLLHEKGT